MHRSPTKEMGVEGAQLHAVVRHGHRANLGEAELGDRIEHARIDLESASVDDSGPCGYGDIRTHSRNQPILNDDCAGFDDRTSHRGDFRTADRDSLLTYCRCRNECRNSGGARQYACEFH
jgi:hypothetical protein